MTPLCSPTRAALLTGRNHHEVGMRSISNFNTGFPNMRGYVSPHAATMAEVLRDEGYATFAVGKWHLCQMEDASAAGPFDQWPCQRGFDRYYGFLDGETDQFSPDLVADNHRVEPPGARGRLPPERGPRRPRHRMLHDTTSIRPDRPFFLYLAFGATHAPHQAPAAYLERYRGRFDDGWDVARDPWFARQQELGVLPADTQLAPRNPGVEPWAASPRTTGGSPHGSRRPTRGSSSTPTRRSAGSSTRSRGSAELDNTLVLLLSDNGASQEGGPFGVLHEMKYFNFIVETPDEAVARIDDIGGPHSHTNYPWGWAQAGNTPFKWYKQNTHEGGVHVPLIVHWPGRHRRRRRSPRPVPPRDRHRPDHLRALGVERPDAYRGSSSSR